MTGENSIGRAIRMARVTAGENQTEFGARFGVGHGVVGVWEREGRIPENRWAILNELYGVDVAAMTKCEKQNSITIRQKHGGQISGGRMELTHNRMSLDLSDEERFLIKLLREKDPNQVFLRRTIADLLLREEPDK